jgi:hypothetical protein
MKRICVILAFIFIASFAAEAQTVPTKVKNYLNLNYPNWVIAKQYMPSENGESTPDIKAIDKGDFNGDGKLDYAVIITKDDRRYVIALIAAKNSYKAYNLSADGSGLRIGVVKKGEKISSENANGKTKSLRLKNDGVGLSDQEGILRTYYWQNSKFLWMDDNY